MRTNNIKQRHHQPCQYTIFRAMDSSKLRPSLASLLNVSPLAQQPSYDQINGRQVLRGGRGHSCFFFIKPIIEGSFYMEFIGHKPPSPEPDFQNQPSLRVGVAPTEYYYNYPLGQSHSIGYKMNGGVVQCGQQTIRLSPYAFGDVVGVGVSVCEVFKDRDKNRQAAGNFVQFYVNGREAGPRTYGLTEDFFTFSASLYNGCLAQTNIDRNDIRYLPCGFRPYADHLPEVSGYKDSEVQFLEKQSLSILECARAE